MRIAFVLVLLLAACVRPAWAQDTRLPSPLQALPASLTPAASTASAPLHRDMRRNRELGGFVGGIVGGVVVGLLVYNVFICNESGEGQGPCLLVGTGLGIVAGAIAGTIIGLPDGSPPRE
jgi:predicted lipid-binding transport protein (Tim44 family)